MSALGEELGELSRQLRSVHPVAYASLNPGIDPEVAVEVLGMPLPPSVLEWFSWRNGSRYERGQLQDDVDIIPGYGLLSAEEALPIRQSHVADEELGEKWVPILWNPGGDMYAAVWGGRDDAAVVSAFEGEGAEPEFDSMADMVRFFNACYSRGAFFADEGFLDVNESIESIIHGEMFG